MVEMLVAETGDLMVVRTELQLAEELVDMLVVLMMQLQVVMMVDCLELTMALKLVAHTVEQKVDLQVAKMVG